MQAGGGHKYGHNSTKEPFYTGNGSAYIKLDGVNQKLKGTALTDFIKRRLT